MDCISCIIFSHKMEDIEFTLNCYDDVLKLFSDVVDKKKKLRPLDRGYSCETSF